MFTDSDEDEPPPPQLKQPPPGLRNEDIPALFWQVVMTGCRMHDLLAIAMLPRSPVSPLLLLQRALQHQGKGMGTNATLLLPQG